MNRSAISAAPGKGTDIVRSVLHVSDQLGVREWLRGLDYFRCIEYPLVFEALRPVPGRTLLDMGCGSGPFALFLAHHAGVRVEALDLDPGSVAWQNRGARRLGLDPTTFSAIEGDSRSLPHADGTFDMVLNLGSIEHIRDEGDIVSAREMARVLKPGGRAVVSIPYGPRCFVIESGPHVSGFERRYDDEALQRRLVTPSNLQETSRVYFGEPGFAASSVWYSIPKLLKLPFRRFAPRLARRWLARIDAEDRAHAGGVCLVMDKLG